MMFRNMGLVVLSVLGLLGGCTDNDKETYPVTGEQCGPEDPVKQLDANDCFIPPAGV